jgi:hypothetical protein
VIQSRGQRFLGLANKSAPKRFVSEYVKNPHHANAPDDIRILLLALGADKLLTRKATDPGLQFCHLETLDSILTWISQRDAGGYHPRFRRQSQLSLSICGMSRKRCRRTGFDPESFI